MKSLLKWIVLPAVLLVATVFATPSTASAHGWGYGHSYGYRPYVRSYHYAPSYYSYPAYNYYSYPSYGYYGGYCY